MNQKNRFKLDKMLVTRHKDLSTLERIEASYADPKVTLSESEESIRKRLSACFSLQCGGKSPVQVVKIIKKTYKVTEQQAYVDIKNSVKLFGNVQSSDKQGIRNILFEYAMKVYRLAAKNNQINEMNKAITNMIKIKGLDFDDSNAPDFSAIQNNQFNITLPDATLVQLAHIANGGVIDVTEILKKDDPGVE